MDAMAPGSYLVISHATADSFRELDDAIQTYTTASSSMHNRTRAEVEALFAGLDLVEPGVVWLSQWHPDADTGLADDPGRSLCWCGVARKPAARRAAPAKLMRPSPASGRAHRG